MPAPPFQQAMTGVHGDMAEARDWVDKAIASLRQGAAGSTNGRAQLGHAKSAVERAIGRASNRFLYFHGRTT